jgi:ribonuclease HII
LIIQEHNLPLFTEPGPYTDFDPFYHESIARNNGHRLIAGVDEAGRGPLAGPVTAAAVIIPERISLSGVKDSKKMSATAREKAYALIDEKAIAIGIGVVSHRAIDQSDILSASLAAMKLALQCLEPAPDFVLIDGIHKVPVDIPQMCIKRGDQLSMSISAASIIAKVYRDRIMCSYHNQFPEYGFDRHKGYGTRYHLSALRRHGPCRIHRLTFKGTR